MGNIAALLGGGLVLAGVGAFMLEIGAAGPVPLILAVLGGLAAFVGAVATAVVIALDAHDTRRGG